MSQLNDIPIPTLHFYLTAPYECSYIPGLLARSQVASPSTLVTPKVYSELIKLGFRRSGSYTYRPRCDTCQACVPLRVAVRDFAPSRTQRRTWAKHGNLFASLLTLEDKPEYYALYQRYQAARHQHGGMDDDDPESYRNFLLQSHVNTLLVEFREPVQPDNANSPQSTPTQGALRMVSVIDVLEDGLSSVYTFFEPDQPGTSYGVYNVLWQINLCHQLGLEYVYLGYWIKQSRKMSYKTQYQPAQGLINGSWHPVSKQSP